MVFIDRILRTVNYLLATGGMSLILLSGPLPVLLLAEGVRAKYGVILKSTLGKLGFQLNVFPLWLTPLVSIILTISLALIGFLVWLPSWRFLQKRWQLLENKGSPDIDQRLYSYRALFLAGVSILGDLLMLGLYFLIVFLSFGWGSSRTPREMYLYLLSVLLLTGLLLGHLRIALSVMRYRGQIFRR